MRLVVGTAAAAALFAAVWLRSAPPPVTSTHKEPDPAPRAQEQELPGADYLEAMLRREPPAARTVKIKNERLARLLQSENPDDAAALAELAEVRLESGQGCRPPSEVELTVGREAVKRADVVARSAVDPLDAREWSAVLRAKLALKLAEGLAEDAIGVASDYVQAAPKSFGAYLAKAHALLAAACSRACAARHQEQLLAHAPDGAVWGAKHPSSEAGTLRAAAMWRVMEAGRTLEAAAEAAAGEEAARAAEASRGLRELDAFKVSSTEQLWRLARCEMYEGVRLDGKRCPREDANPYAKSKKKRKKSS